MEGVGGVGGGQQEGAAGATRSNLSFIAELTKFSGWNQLPILDVRLPHFIASRAFE